MNILGRKIADAGYYINLDSSTDRKENVEKQIIDFQIENLTRLSALTDEARQSSATKSHRKVFELCKENKIESVVVLEDDFQLYQDVSLGSTQFSKPLGEYLDELLIEIENVDWDVILLGFNGRRIAIPMSKNLSRVFSCTGGWGYIIKRDAYNFILDNFDYGRDRQAIDDILPKLSYHGFDVLATNIQVVHHGVGFESTLDPKGPVNYTEWINGNYYNSIWRHIKNLPSFDRGLEDLYNNSKFSRENIIVLKNYPRDASVIENFIKSNELYLTSFVFLNYDEVTDEEMRNLNYHFSVESRLLVNWTCNLDKIKKYYQNIIEIDLSLIDNY